MPRRCLDLKTGIRLFDNSIKTLAELISDFNNGIENYTYSVSPKGEIVPGLISWAGITNVNADLVEVTLDNNEVIRCTPEHKFIMRDGTKKKAGKLQTSDELSAYLINNKNFMISDFRIVNSVKTINEKAVVGTLTIDENHIYNDFHNFALASGIFVMNSGGSGTDVQTLPGQTNQGAQEDLEYFQKKLFRSLNVPLQRLIQETGFSIGRASEITREEIKFSKLINRLRRKFSILFTQALYIQLRLKNIVNESEWYDTLLPAIRIDYNKDNYYAELKETEILRERLGLLNDLETYTGKYFSQKWIRQNILKQSQFEIDEMDTEIKKEKDAGNYEDEDGGDYGSDNDLGNNDSETSKPADDEADFNFDDLGKDLETDKEESTII